MQETENAVFFSSNWYNAFLQHFSKIMKKNIKNACNVRYAIIMTKDAKLCAMHVLLKLQLFFQVQ